MWNRNIRLHTINKKHVYKERKETTHGEIGKITYVNIYIHIYKPNISTMYVKWSQEQCTRDNVSKIERKEKIQKSLLYTSYTHSHYHKISYTNPPPMSMITLISKLLPLFVTSNKWQLHQVDISLSLGELAPSSSSTSLLPEPSSLSSLDAGGDGEKAIVKPPMIACRCAIQPTRVFTWHNLSLSVKASIRAHKLCHDGLKCHSTRKRRRSRGGWSGRSWRSSYLCLWLPWSKLSLTPFDGSPIYGTHDREMRGHGKRDRKMVKDPRDSRRKKSISRVAISL